MSRNGVAFSVPFCRIRMVPPCSTTNKRPVLSWADSMPKGFVRPLTIGESASVGDVVGGGVVPPFPPPHEVSKSASSSEPDHKGSRIEVGLYPQVRDAQKKSPRER